MQMFVPTDKPREGDISFSSDTLLTVGRFDDDDDEDFTEDDVTYFIKYGDPELFERLNGLPLRSTDIPLSFHGQRTLQRLQQIKALYDERVFSTTPQQGWHLDGIGQSAILASADRLCPVLQPVKLDYNEATDKDGFQDQPFNYPSNSPRARRLRAYKQYELNQNLAEIAKYEKAMAKANELQQRRTECSVSPDVSVLITRPVYMEPTKERYKKQGLTRHDQWKSSREMKHLQDLHNLGAPPPVSPLKSAFEGGRICVCREFEDDNERIACSATSCPITWFHVKCTGLRRLPTITERFFCCYCSDGNDGSFVIEEIQDRQTFAFSRSATPTKNNYLLHEYHSQDNENQVDLNIDAVEAGADSDDDDGAADYDFDTEVHDKRLYDNIVRWTTINQSRATPNSVGYSAARSTESSEPEDNSTIKESSSIAETDDEGVSAMIETDGASSVRCNSSSTNSGEERDQRRQLTQGAHSEDKQTANTNRLSLRQHSSNITGSTLTTAAGSSMWTTIPDLPPSFHATTATDVEAPSTPRLMPTYRSSKPWGTPIIINSPTFDRLPGIREPGSPTPTKRQAATEGDLGLSPATKRRFCQLEEHSGSLRLGADDEDDEVEEVVTFVLD